MQQKTIPVENYFIALLCACHTHAHAHGRARAFVHGVAMPMGMAMTCGCAWLLTAQVYYWQTCILDILRHDFGWKCAIMVGSWHRRCFFINVYGLLSCVPSLVTPRLQSPRKTTVPSSFKVLRCMGKEPAPVERRLQLKIENHLTPYLKAS